MNKKIKIIAYVGPSGSRLYRVEQVFKYLNRLDDFECVISPTAIEDEQLLWSDIVMIQGLVDPKQIATLWAYQMERGKKIVSDRDDVIVVEDHNPFRPAHIKYNAATWTRQLLGISDLVTVTTEEIAQEIRPLNKKVEILPNCLDMEMWDRLPVTNDTNMVRIGYTASITHRKDLEMVAPAIKNVLMANPNVKFVICGDLYLTKWFEDVPKRQIEFVDGTTNFYKWADKAFSLSLDIGIGPLIENHFNRGRSFLKFLEYSMMGCPGVYSPAAYKDVIKPDMGFIAHNLKEWEEYLTLLIKDAKLRHKMGKNARRFVRNNYDMRKWVGKYADLFRKLV